MKKILAVDTRVAQSSATVDAADSPAVAGNPSCEKRQQLVKMLAEAKESGCGDDLISLIQKEIDTLPTPQVGGQLQEAGRLYQEKAKQEKHHAAQLAALDAQAENIAQQRLKLDELEKQLTDQKKQAEAQHVSNMERIDAAI